MGLMSYAANVAPDHPAQSRSQVMSYPVHLHNHETLHDFIADRIATDQTAQRHKNHFRMVVCPHLRNSNFQILYTESFNKNLMKT
ncbi:hypothetical protein DPMN_080084 [Dreissena polymorpha]|uniref:Uncharacterized protein n=1 Tax=Dreissena polymorpha TaxID=45954 RepID=A0A9D3YRZ1_DREPO|nr:hypothetical protein DPMN_080084 [Dreissena polymorpha]